MINISWSREPQRAEALNWEADFSEKDILVEQFIVHIYLKQGCSLRTLSRMFDLVFSETIINDCRLETEIPVWTGCSSFPERPIRPFTSWISAPVILMQHLCLSILRRRTDLCMPISQQVESPSPNRAWSSPSLIRARLCPKDCNSAGRPQLQNSNAEEPLRSSIIIISGSHAAVILNNNGSTTLQQGPFVIPQAGESRGDSSAFSQTNHFYVAQSFCKDVLTCCSLLFGVCVKKPHHHLSHTHTKQSITLRNWWLYKSMSFMASR